MITDHFVELLITLLMAFAASSGFWLYLDKRFDRRSSQTELLIGLAHHFIIEQALSYIMRGWITQDEYESLERYLYRPYHKLGGNGTADRIMIEVNKLPIRENTYTPTTPRRRKKNEFTQ